MIDGSKTRKSLAEVEVPSPYVIERRNKGRRTLHSVQTCTVEVILQTAVFFRDGKVSYITGRL